MWDTFVAFIILFLFWGVAVPIVVVLVGLQWIASILLEVICGAGIALVMI